MSNEFRLVTHTLGWVESISANVAQPNSQELNINNDRESNSRS